MSISLPGNLTLCHLRLLFSRPDNLRNAFLVTENVIYVSGRNTGQRPHEDYQKRMSTIREARGGDFCFTCRWRGSGAVSAPLAGDNPKKKGKNWTKITRNPWKGRKYQWKEGREKSRRPKLFEWNGSQARRVKVTCHSLVCASRFSGKFQSKNVIELTLNLKRTRPFRWLTYVTLSLWNCPADQSQVIGPQTKSRTGQMGCCPVIK